MNYILAREKQDQFINALVNKQMCDDEEMAELIEGCTYFYHKIYGNSYFLSKSNETELRKQNIPNTFISSVYDLTDNFNFMLEEISADFVDFLLQHHSNVEQSIDEDISLIQSNFIKRYE